MENLNHIQLLAEHGFTYPVRPKRFSRVSEYGAPERRHSCYLAFDYKNNIGEFDNTAFVETDGHIFNIEQTDLLFNLEGRTILASYRTNGGRYLVIITDRDLLVITSRRYYSSAENPGDPYTPRIIPLNHPSEPDPEPEPEHSSPTHPTPKSDVPTSETPMHTEPPVAATANVPTAAPSHTPALADVPDYTPVNMDVVARCATPSYRNFNFPSIPEVEANVAQISHFRRSLNRHSSSSAGSASSTASTTHSTSESDSTPSDPASTVTISRPPPSSHTSSLEENIDILHTYRAPNILDIIVVNIAEIDLKK